MSDHKTNTNSFLFCFFFVIANFFFYKTVTMASGLTNPSYQTEGVRYTVSPSMQKLQGQVDEVTNVMRDNIQLELDRGGKLGELETKADMLNVHSQQFERGAKRVKNKFWWKNVKMWIILIIVILVIIGIIVGIVVASTKNKKPTTTPKP